MKFLTIGFSIAVLLSQGSCEEFDNFEIGGYHPYYDQGQADYYRGEQFQPLPLHRSDPHMVSIGNDNYNSGEMEGPYGFQPETRAMMADDPKPAKIRPVTRRPSADCPSGGPRKIGIRPIKPKTPKPHASFKPLRFKTKEEKEKEEEEEDDER
ncbi:unnamed protein product [Orchesella dallaii]|uniref:Uncharacterized protein n=1 Tax=Orchesella dallaii TaxID=48710 RepID=A0ABP1RAV0_9HEXA